MENTKTKIQGKVVKVVTTVFVENADLLNILDQIGMSTFAEVVCVTEPRMNKRGNPFLEKVEKVARMNVNFGGIYKNAVEKKMEKEGIEGGYEPAPLQWGQRWGSSLVIIEHKGQFYAQMRPLRADDVLYRWKDTKEKLSVHDVENMKKFFPPKKEGSRQPSEDKVIIRTVKIDNIKEVRMEGKRYIKR